MDDIAALKKLAGIGDTSKLNDIGSNISLTGTEKARLMREHNIKPGTDAWFKLWFAKPYLTNEKPI
jgi:hypothetical protein